MSVVQLAAVALAIGLGATGERSAGMGLSLIAAPILVLAVGPLEAARLLILVALPLNAFLAVLLRRHVVLPLIPWLALPAMLVTPLLSWAVRLAPERTLVLLAGAATLGSVALLATGARSRPLAGRAGAVIAGTTSAAMNVVAGLSGPAAALYGVNAGWDVQRLRAMLQTYFLALGAVALPSLGLPQLPSPTYAAVAAGAVSGLAAGHHIAQRVPEHIIQRLVLMLSALGGTLAIAQALR